MVFQIFFYPSLEVTGVHVFECDTSDISYAFTRWAINHPTGISYGCRESNQRKSGWVIYKDDITKTASTTTSLRDKFEARKSNKK
jgi:hypothetical protein